LAAEFLQFSATISLENGEQMILICKNEGPKLIFIGKIRANSEFAKCDSPKLFPKKKGNGGAKVAEKSVK